MAFLPGIFGKANAPAPQAAPQQQGPQPVPGGSLPASQQVAGPSNPAANPANMGNNPAQPPAGGPVPGVASPMDSFADMFKPKPVDPNAPKVPTLSDPFLGPLDPAAFRTQVSQANFAASIPQDTIQKAISGDSQAFADAINTAAREAFAAAAQLSHGLVEHGSRTAAERVSGSLDSRIRNFQIKSQNTNHEALAHPAVAPMLNAVKMQIATSNPQLSPDQVQQQAETYFTQMADVLTAPKQAAKQAAQTPKEFDFSSYLS
jgi:hypothetical protein